MSWQLLTMRTRPLDLSSLVPAEDQRWRTEVEASQRNLVPHVAGESTRTCRLHVYASMEQPQCDPTVQRRWNAPAAPRSPGERGSEWPLHEGANFQEASGGDAHMLSAPHRNLHEVFPRCTRDIPKPNILNQPACPHDLPQQASL